LKREYNFEELARRHGFNVREIEKVCRISDVLEDISAVKFLKDRLSLYGGTALTFIYSEEILRLSIDLDLNYRHVDKKDWGEVRSEIDERIKALLYRQEYKESDLAISPSYPLARITVQYTNTQDLKDNYNIEIGYMRRYPILKTDTLANFKHIGTQETFTTMTPMKEELLANKWCALLYRKTPRDLFDVYQTTKMSMNPTIFRKCAIIDSLMRGEPKLQNIKIEETINKIPIDSSLRNLLRAEKFPRFNFNEMTKQTIKFSKSIIASLTKNEIKTIDQFYEHKIFKPELIDKEGILHEKIKEHPSIQWALTTLS
jgi:predicted nucleotidyltransferase component of viral defense system